MRDEDVSPLGGDPSSSFTLEDGYGDEEPSRPVGGGGPPLPPRLDPWGGSGIGLCCDGGGGGGGGYPPPYAPSYIPAHGGGGGRLYPYG